MKFAKIVSSIAGIFLLSACSNIKAPPTANSQQESEPASAPYLPTIFEAKGEARVSQTRLNDPRPNIIFILTDDQPYHTIQYMPTVRDVLVKQGVNFENGFLTTPLCCPSRVSILTGEYVHNYKVFTDRMPLGERRNLTIHPHMRSG